MCDTLIAAKYTTANGVAIFGKNSDRPPNEGQHIVCFPAADHPAGRSLKCTYIEIPQVEHTHAVLLSKPFWMWGAEMGANEHGLVIGNEAIFSKIPANKEPALLGMDMLRAALERAATPREALQVIISLLEKFGQGGNCVSHGNTIYYHNSFMIANAEEAWVLETVDKQWAAKQVKDAYSISNCFTIGSEYDMASSNIIDLATQKRITKSTGQFHFAKTYSDFIITTFGKGLARRKTTACILEEQKGKVSIESMMSTLRHHTEETFDPQKSIDHVDVCMHSGFGPIRSNQSTASMVVHLDNSSPIIFATGTSAPCTSIFKPFWIDAASSLNLGPVPTSQAESSSIYWTHEKLHRATLLNYSERIKTYASERDEMETRFIQGALKIQTASAEDRAAFTNQCLAESAAAEEEWLKRVEKIPAKRKPLLYSIAWNGFNKKAKIIL